MPPNRRPSGTLFCWSRGRVTTSSVSGRRTTRWPAIRRCAFAEAAALDDDLRQQRLRKAVSIMTRKSPATQPPHRMSSSVPTTAAQLSPSGTIPDQVYRPSETCSRRLGELLLPSKFEFAVHLGTEQRLTNTQVPSFAARRSLVSHFRALRSAAAAPLANLNRSACPSTCEVHAVRCRPTGRPAARGPTTLRTSR